jgi:alpha-galactosidase
MLYAQPFQVKKNGLTLTYNKQDGTYSLSKDQVAYIHQASAYLALANGQKN